MPKINPFPCPFGLTLPFAYTVVCLFTLKKHQEDHEGDGITILVTDYEYFLNRDSISSNFS